MELDWIAILFVIILTLLLMFGPIVACVCGHLVDILGHSRPVRNETIEVSNEDLTLFDPEAFPQNHPHRSSTS